MLITLIFKWLQFTREEKEEEVEVVEEKEQENREEKGEDIMKINDYIVKQKSAL